LVGRSGGTAATDNLERIALHLTRTTRVSHVGRTRVMRRNSKQSIVAVSHSFKVQVPRRGMRRSFVNQLSDARKRSVLDN
jgi:hypothetical protein